MVEKGGANVHLGMMYLDSHDSIDVFSHEISHLLGFVDEYPLAKSHERCLQPQPEPFSHNIAVLNNTYYGDRTILREQILKAIPWAQYISNKTPILQKILGQEKTWRLGTPENNNDHFGLFIAESCDNSSVASKLDISAYKPIAKRTQLRYFAKDFPQEYVTLLSDQSKQFLMPSFHYNMALALYQHGIIEEAKYWLEQATLWEKNSIRRKRIRQGGL
jgi:hypothetical protein